MTWARFPSIVWLLRGFGAQSLSELPTVGSRFHDKLLLPNRESIFVGKKVQHSPVAHRLKMSQICVTYRHSLRRKAGCLSGFPLKLFKTFLRPWSSKMKACSFQLFFVICPSGRKAADINRESINSAWNYQFPMRKEEIFRESNKLFFQMKVE